MFIFCSSNYNFFRQALKIRLAIGKLSCLNKKIYLERMGCCGKKEAIKPKEENLFEVGVNETSEANK
jgi:hypothetical protein